MPPAPCWLACWACCLVFIFLIGSVCVGLLFSAFSFHVVFSNSCNFRWGCSHIWRQNLSIGRPSASTSVAGLQFRGLGGTLQEGRLRVQSRTFIDFGWVSGPPNLKSFSSTSELDTLVFGVRWHAKNIFSQISIFCL